METNAVMIAPSYCLFNQGEVTTIPSSHALHSLVVSWLSIQLLPSQILYVLGLLNSWLSRDTPASLVVFQFHARRLALFRDSIELKQGKGIRTSWSAGFDTKSVLGEQPEHHQPDPPPHSASTMYPHNSHA